MIWYKRGATDILAEGGIVGYAKGTGGGWRKLLLMVGVKRGMMDRRGQAVLTDRAHPSSRTLHPHHQ